ncbi:MAG TPA: rhodanese-like domain-containing protein, partial [Verrucomicrobiae bacterium]|nr:rhodanese-like domain-containing protein [Verrucomicrobiae bacterium]
NGLSHGGELVHADRSQFVKDNSSQRSVSVRLDGAIRIVGEAATVATLGMALAFFANQVSPGGLSLTRDYFPSGTAHTVRPVAAAEPPHASGTNSEPLALAQLLAAQMKEKGLQLIDQHQALQYFHDLQSSPGAIIFVDARDKDHYQAGHIPGAYEFDPYHPEDYFPIVLPACQKARQIVVYCRGGDCDDSESAALLLRDVGVPNQKILVYAGGFTEWTASHLPVETGERNSEILLSTNAPPATGALPGTAYPLNTNK